MFQTVANKHCQLDTINKEYYYSFLDQRWQDLVRDRRLRGTEDAEKFLIAVLFLSALVFTIISQVASQSPDMVGRGYQAQLQEWSEHPGGGKKEKK